MAGSRRSLLGEDVWSRFNLFKNEYGSSPQPLPTFFFFTFLATQQRGQIRSDVRQSLAVLVVKIKSILLVNGPKLRADDLEGTNVSRKFTSVGISEETSVAFCKLTSSADENSPDLSHECHKAKVHDRYCSSISARARTRASQVTFDPPLPCIRLLKSVDNQQLYISKCRGR